MDKDDLAILCRDLTKAEVDRVHRLIHEWSIGPEDSFPAQLSLLTRAQFKAAASIPRSIADGCILTLSLIGGPKFVPVVISTSFIEGAKVAETFCGPELPATFEPTLFLATR